MSGHDADARALWRAFLLEPTKDTAYVWARAEARLRSELPDPPVAEAKLADLAPVLNRLAGGAAGRLNLLMQGRVLATALPVRLYDLADTDPEDLSADQGAGAITMFAAAFGMRALGVHRLAWEAWLLRARRVYPGAHQTVAGRATGDRFLSAVAHELDGS